ncbi:MAG: AmmeMemoRadiSam system radical SAM enzyme [Kiritimatiellales bacterium]|nr:AmmeMemoRadiSam system radical SAM enzyme [Kiritimatiellales bacterium]
MSAEIRCTLCPKGCLLEPGEFGDCRIRQNQNGEIRCVTYGHPCSINIDPVEKKPLYHFLPGSTILSIATIGCNLHCKQCQNWQISQAEYLGSRDEEVLPAEIVRIARERNCPAIAYTYTEPLVSYEYTLDCCKTASESGIKNVLVTAAYINPDPLKELCCFVDAANVDLKSFSDEFYHEVCGASLKPVLRALKIMKESGVMLEITNLIIPTLNDSEEETQKLCEWVVDNLGEGTPLHLSRFFPQNKLLYLCPTPPETILRAREIALASGLQFVYVGNMADDSGEKTFCPGCGGLLIERRGYTIRQMQVSDGKCGKCGTKIPGVWK